MEKKIFNAGIISFGVLLLLTVVFYKAHAVLLDNSFFLFDILSRGSFAIHHSRYIAVFTQLLTVGAMKLAMPLKTVAILYSSAFILFYFTCFLLAGVGLKNYKLAISLFLINVLFITDTFFWQLSEIMQGIALMMPVFALIIDRNRPMKWWHYILLAAGVITVSFAHPIMLFPFTFAWLFILLSKNIVVKRKILIGVGVLFIVSAVVKRLLFSDAYETSSMNGLNNLVNLFPNYIDLYSNKNFIKNWAHIYYWIPVSLLLITVTYVRYRSWLKLLLVVVFFAGYAFLINVSYPTDYTPDFYIENLYIPLSVFLVIPLVYDVFPRLFKLHKHLPLTISLLMTITCFYRINTSHEFFKSRINWYKEYMAAHRNEKILTSFSTVPKEKIIMAWASPYECWLLSTLETDSTQSILIHDNLPEILWAWSYRKEFVTTWGVFEYKDLDPQYFKFRDTTNVYRVIEPIK